MISANQQLNFSVKAPDDQANRRSCIWVDVSFVAGPSHTCMAYLYLVGATHNTEAGVLVRYTVELRWLEILSADLVYHMNHQIEWQKLSWTSN
jgi:hypothetical protein